MITTIRWTDASGIEAGSLNHFVDYGQWAQLAEQSHKNSHHYGFLSIDLKKYNIETRYLIIDCNFTLKPLNGAKI
jgi:hypothetical protein